MSSITQINDQAAAWVLRLEIDGAAAGPELIAWLGEDERNVAAFADAQARWAVADARLRELAPTDGSVDLELLSPANVRAEGRAAEVPPGQPTSVWSALAGFVGRIGRSYATGAAAAVVVLAVMIATVFLPNRGAEYSTEIGEVRTVGLDDGSTVVLNTGTLIRVQYWAGRRAVHLLKGEALFEVVHADPRPFDVIAGDTTVHSIGTRFVVRRYDEGAISVLVTEGRVAVADVKGGHLRAGDFAKLKSGRAVVQHLTTDEINGMLKWRTQWLVVRDQALREVVTEINRYNERKIIIASPSIMELRIGGTFPATQPDVFARSLGPFGIRSRVTPLEITLLAPRPEVTATPLSEITLPIGASPADEAKNEEDR